MGDIILALQLEGFVKEIGSLFPLIVLEIDTADFKERLSGSRLLRKVLFHGGVGLGDLSSGKQFPELKSNTPCLFGPSRLRQPQAWVNLDQTEANNTGGQP